MSFHRDYEVIGDIQDIEIIATGRGIRRLPYLRRRFGRGKWRKLKGVAKIRRRDGKIFEAELHWYEAHGIGRKLIKVKRFLD